jgi:cytochrome c553
MILALLGTAVPGVPTAAAELSAPQRDYILACAGCHGLHGVSNSSLVPSLQGLVGYFLDLPEGRAYLSRLPNVAFSTLSDEQLAAVLNYMVFEVGAASAPAGARPYVAAEVGGWRKQPLTEVTLSAYRRRLVETLIRRYGAPATLRGYGVAAIPPSAPRRTTRSGGARHAASNTNSIRTSAKSPDEATELIHNGL